MTMPVAESFATRERNVSEALSRAEVNRRWLRWNGGAPSEQRRRQLEATVESWRKLAAQAPDNRFVQASLEDARQMLMTP